MPRPRWSEERTIGSPGAEWKGRKALGRTRDLDWPDDDEWADLEEEEGGRYWGLKGTPGRPHGPHNPVPNGPFRNGLIKRQK